jgi:hypothetical protein
MLVNEYYTEDTQGPFEEFKLEVLRRTLAHGGVLRLGVQARLSPIDSMLAG